MVIRNGVGVGALLFARANLGPAAGARGTLDQLWSGSGFAVRAAMIAQNAATSRLKHTAVSE